MGVVRCWTWGSGWEEQETGAEDSGQLWYLPLYSPKRGLESQPGGVPRSREGWQVGSTGPGRLTSTSPHSHSFHQLGGQNQRNQRNRACRRYRDIYDLSPGTDCRDCKAGWAGHGEGQARTHRQKPILQGTGGISSRGSLSFALGAFHLTG